MAAADYYHLMKGFVDAMESFGAPFPDDELIDYILASFGKEFVVLQASLNVVFSNANPKIFIHLTDVYSMIFFHEAMQEQVKHEIDFSSSANDARRGNNGGVRFGGGQGGAQ
jgi:hypothetical protein